VPGPDKLSGDLYVYVAIFFSAAALAIMLASICGAL